MSNERIVLTETDLKEIFSLFSSATKYERDQVYETGSAHHYSNIDAAAEYSLTQEKREYALDAWRAVIFFLNSKGYSLCRDQQRYELTFIEEDFVG